ncbi:PREDICTED: multivesicular body subunit 12A [Nanorana parkeri]|uniref:multivesicular body subunit 12A n=1 Tax=Nanorana parkeri TaxID=125878 RepID=UPI000854CF52|nr:PREDICTED: multivesicular body subunit 12A [Nanorana parkeri]
MDGNSKPLTSLAWTSGQSLCPKGHNLIVATMEGASANFLKGFNQKSALYLTCSTEPTSETIEQVITDVMLLSEKSPLPVGYAFIGEYIDPKITVPKKKRLCMKLTPINTAESAVAELKLTVKNKQLTAPYKRIGDMSGLALWCRNVPVSAPKPTPKPRNVTSGVRGLSLDSSSSAQPATQEAPVPKLSRASSISEHPIYESNVYGVSAIDGIPFTIHPMFESRLAEPSIISSNLHDLRIKTLADIENEYNYGFVVERTACAR